MSIMNWRWGRTFSFRLMVISPLLEVTLSSPNTSFSVSALRDSIRVSESVVPNSV